MKTSFLSYLFSCCVLVLCSCHSAPSSTPPHPPARLSDSATRDSVQHNAPPPEARDSVREAPTENYDTIDPATRAHFREVQAFLDYIKRPSPDGVMPDVWRKNFRVANIDSFLHFITAGPLEIDDADADPGKDSLKYTRGTLRKQLAAGKGEAFQMIAQLSLIYSEPYPQYSHTTFGVNKQDSIPNVNVTFDSFELYFRYEGDSTAYKLFRIESDEISDL